MFLCVHLHMYVHRDEDPVNSGLGPMCWVEVSPSWVSLEQIWRTNSSCKEKRVCNVTVFRLKENSES